MTGGDTSHYTIEDVCMVTIRYSTTLCEYSERRHPIQIAQNAPCLPLMHSLRNSYQCDSRLSTCRILVWDVWSKKKKSVKVTSTPQPQKFWPEKKEKNTLWVFFLCAHAALRLWRPPNWIALVPQPMSVPLLTASMLCSNRCVLNQPRNFFF